MPGLTRHPVPRDSWIGDVETPDLIRGRNDRKSCDDGQLSRKLAQQVDPGRALEVGAIRAHVLLEG